MTPAQGNDDGVGVTWRQHPRTGKWHAWPPHAAWSVCGYANKAVGDGLPGPPAGCCHVCWRALGAPPGSLPQPVEQVVVEFIGGALDGVRLNNLQVLRGPGEIKVFAGRFTPKRDPPTIVIDVRPPGVEPVGEPAARKRAPEVER